jgi:hypothetical protein
MSEALRALADAEDAAFDSPPDTQETEQQTPESPQTPDQTPDEGDPSTQEERQPDEKEPKGEQKEPQKGKKLSKFELAKREKEKDRKRADQAYAKAAKAAEEAAQARAEAEHYRQEAEAAKRQAKIDSNPALKQAINLLEQGYTPEDLEKDAKELENQGNFEGAKGSRAIAAQMQRAIEQQQRESYEQQARRAQDQWQHLDFGTPEFDAAAGMINRDQNPEAFDACWSKVEQGLLNQLQESSDPLDKELASQFADPNSEFGKRMTFFLRNTAFGNGFRQHALGILPAYDMVKATIREDQLRADNEKLRAELTRLRGHTSLGTSAPASYVNGGSKNHLAPELSIDEFASLPVDKMRERLRAREKS